MPGDVDQLSQLIGSLQATQEGLRRDIDGMRKEIRGGFSTLERNFEARINEIRQSYHDLNNKAMVELGRMENEFHARVKALEDSYESRIGSLGVRMTGVENMVKDRKLISRVNHVWINALVGLVCSGLTLAADYMLRR